jgi:hypothetical protein
LPILQTLIAALLSGMISAMLIFALNERRDRTAFLLQKAETAAAAYTEWYESIPKLLSDHYELFFPLPEDRKRANDNIAIQYREIGAKSAKSQMLIHIYLPAELSAVSELLKAYSEILQYSNILRTAYLNNKPAPADMHEKIGELGISLVKAGSTGQALLYNAANKMAYKPHLIRLPNMHYRRQKIVS